MGKKDFIGGGQGLSIEDVGGSFRRFVEEFPKLAQAEIRDAVDKTAFALSQRMRAMAPVGPDAPHIREAITWKRTGARGAGKGGASAEVGLIDATEQAGPTNPATLAAVALFNEYRPNAQPFMRPAAELEARDFLKRMEAAIRNIERSLQTTETLGGTGTTTFEGPGESRSQRGTLGKTNPAKGVKGVTGVFGSGGGGFL